MIAYFVYLMCALTSAACTGLLYHKYRLRRTRLLLLSGLCFGCLALNNILLFADLLLGAEYNLSVIRTAPAVVGFGILVWGLIRETT